MRRERWYQIIAGRVVGLVEVREPRDNKVVMQITGFCCAIQLIFLEQAVILFDYEVSGTMKKCMQCALGVAILMLFPVVSQATITVSSLYNTGEKFSGAPVQDDAYTVTYGGGPTTAQAMVVDPVVSKWVPNDGDSRWISVRTNAKGQDLQSVIYTTSFVVSSDDAKDDAARLSIFGNWSADDLIAEVKVNGIVVSGLTELPPPNVYQTLHPFAISGKDVTWKLNDTNTISFKVNDTDRVVSGFRLDDKGWEVSAGGIPEPGTVAIWGLLSSLVGFGFLRSKRQA